MCLPRTRATAAAVWHACRSRFAGLTMSSPPHAGCYAVALLNGLATPAQGATFELGWVGWSNTTRVSVRDMWAHADLPVATGAVVWAAPLAPHAVVALRLCKL